MRKFPIRNMLQQNEPYSRLKHWFYECGQLCNLQEQFKTYEEYEAEFNKHIVSSCNNPKADYKSCRKISRSNKQKLTKKQQKNNKTSSNQQ
jgi:hypothetical protein